MYKIFGNLVSSPITAFLTILLVVFLIFSGINMFDSIKTSLGFETKENVKEKLVNTTTELDKVVVINENNKKDKELNESIDSTNKNITDTMKVIEKDIIEDNKKIQELLSKEDVIIEDTKEPIIINNTKIVKEEKPLTKRQIENIDLIVNRSLTLKGVSK